MPSTAFAQRLWEVAAVDELVLKARGALGR